MLKNIEITKVLFLDIETTPASATLLEAPENIQDLWLKKSEKKYVGENPMQTYTEKSALFGEYCKIACISFGSMGQTGKFSVKSLYGSNEKAILEEFCAILSNASFKTASFCAHNGFNFDFTIIAKRCLANSLEIPWMFDSYGKKPWDMEHLLDTLKIWNGMAWGGGGTLDELCAVFEIPTPKGEMDGSKVREKYYSGDHLEIATYCEGDVIALCRVFQAMKLLPMLGDEDVIVKTVAKEVKLESATKTTEK